MSEYKLSDFTKAGIHEFVRDLSSPREDLWQVTVRRENVEYFTPVIRLLPPMFRPPFPFEDKLKNETLEFPSKEEWLYTEKSDESSALYHRAIDDFEDYRKKYNDRVEEYYIDHEIEDNIVKQIKSGIQKYERGKSHWEFSTINESFHYDQIDKNFPTPNKWKNETGVGHWRSVDNELVYTTIMDMDDDDAIPIINKTVYDYIKALTGGRELKAGDVFYNPMREFLRWFEVSAIDIETTPNIFEESKKQKAVDVERLFPKIKERTSPRDWEIEHDITKQTLKFTHLGKGGSKKFKYDDCGFNYHKKGETPRRVQLLEHYALWEEMRTESGSTDSATWESCVRISSLKYTQKIQKELSQILKKALNIRGDIFEKLVEKSDGKKYTYFECLIKVKTVQKEKESHKKFTKDSQKKLRSTIGEFHKDKKAGEDDVGSGVYNSLDDKDLTHRR